MLKLSDELKTFFADLRLVYFGTGEFAVPALEKLLAVGVTPLAIVTAPDMKVGREQTLTPSPIKVAAAAAQLSVLQPEKLNESFLNEIKKLKPDIAVLADYGKILPQTLLDIPKHGFLNIHPSLLPKYRGASPIESSILAGEAETGVTVIVIDALLDHGPIVARKKTAMKNKEHAEHLGKRLAILGADLLIHALPRYVERQIEPKEQTHIDATFTRMLSREDGKISFSDDAIAIERKIRAFTPWPGTYALWKTGDGEKRLKILEADVVSIPEKRSADDAPDEIPYGTVLAHENGIGIKTGQDMLIIRHLQLEGKKPMSAKEFLNGYPALVGSVLV